jgi:hypothetical protein
MIKRRAVIVDVTVAKLVDDHVINTVDRRLHKVRIEKDISTLGAASPAVQHLSNGKLGRILQPEGRRSLETHSKADGEEPLRARSLPCRNKLPFAVPVQLVPRPDMEISAFQFDHLRRIFVHFQTILPPEIEAGLA